MPTLPVLVLLMLFPLVVHCWALAVCELATKNSSAKMIAAPNQVFLFVFGGLFFISYLFSELVFENA